MSTEIPSGCNTTLDKWQFYADKFHKQRDFQYSAVARKVREIKIEEMKAAIWLVPAGFGLFLSLSFAFVFPALRVHQDILIVRGLVIGFGSFSATCVVGGLIHYRFGPFALKQAIK